MHAEIKSTGTHQSMHGVTVTGQRTINNTSNYCLINIRAGANSGPELELLGNSNSNSGIGIGIELAFPSLTGIGIELELPVFELELNWNCHNLNWNWSRNCVLRNRIRNCFPWN